MLKQKFMLTRAQTTVKEGHPAHISGDKSRRAKALSGRADHAASSGMLVGALFFETIGGRR
jgi:hypothetical protein